jgi:hypothetical protein
MVTLRIFGFLLNRSNGLPCGSIDAYCGNNEGSGLLVTKTPFHRTGRERLKAQGIIASVSNAAHTKPMPTVF